MHKLPKPELSKRKVNVVGPNDVAEGDMDPPKRATCYDGCWKQLCDVVLKGIK
jgi:hypothetical protein